MAGTVAPSLVARVAVPALAGRPAAVAFARAALYRLLATALAYPDADSAARLRGPCLQAGLRAGRHVDGAARAALRVLASALAALEPEAAERAHALVFGHARSQRVVPYESPYLTTNVFQETDALADVAAFYRAFAVEPSVRRPERPDHVVLELEFLHLLAFKEGHARRHHGADAVAVCAEAQATFLRAHLGRWGVAFFRALSAAAAETHYAALAGVGEAFLRAEAARAGVVPRVIAPRGVPEASDLTCPLVPEVAG